MREFVPVMSSNRGQREVRPGARDGMRAANSGNRSSPEPSAAAGDGGGRPAVSRRPGGYRKRWK